jgi:D-alanine-D-alanine ligase
MRLKLRPQLPLRRLVIAAKICGVRATPQLSRHNSEAAPLGQTLVDHSMACNSYIAARRTFERELAIVRKLAVQTSITICANTKQQAHPPDDYDGFSVTTEYLSDFELAEIMQALDHLGIAAKHYSEQELISLLKGGGYHKSARQHNFVYAARGSGTHRFRSGKVPKACSFYRTPTCSPDFSSVLLAADKYSVFRLLQQHGLPTPDCWLLYENGRWAHDRHPPKGLKVIAKPRYESASIGIDKNSAGPYSESFRQFALRRSKLLRQPIVIQSFISGYEAEVPVAYLRQWLGMPAVGIEVKGTQKLGDCILDYACVAADNYQFYPFHSINFSLGTTLRLIAQHAAEILDMKGLCRVDFRINDGGDAFITDVNALPHLTRHSSCARAAEILDFSHDDLLGIAVACGMNMPRRKSEL